MAANKTPYSLMVGTLADAPFVGLNGAMFAQVTIAGMTVVAGLCATAGSYTAGAQVLVHVFPPGAPGGLGAVVVGVLI